MHADLDLRRALIVADLPVRTALLKMFGQRPLRDWVALAPDSLARARLLLQRTPFQVLLLDERASQALAAEDWAWVKGQQEVGVVLLSRTDPERVTHALANGVHQWLPPALALEHPAVLAAALDQAAGIGDLRKRGRRLRAAFQESRRQVDRLAGLLWRTLPGDGATRWLTQRHVMERFQEEVSRAGRYGAPLTVVLGEVESAAGKEAEPINPWVVDQLTRAKRRCDVAGQYGPHGFLLLLVHTPEAGGVACCGRLRQVLRQPAGAMNGCPNLPRTFFGLAGYSAAASTCARLLGKAEQGLEAAKKAGSELQAV
jgi:GGDEF domain-containing protein